MRHIETFITLLVAISIMMYFISVLILQDYNIFGDKFIFGLLIFTVILITTILTIEIHDQ